MEVKPGYKQTEVGVIPNEWDAVPMGSLGTFGKGQGIRKDEASSGDLPCIRYGEIYTHHNDVVLDFNSRISAIVAAASRRLKKGDLLFAGSGETKEEIGKCTAFVGGEEAYAGGDIVILSPNKGDSRFFGYLFNAPVVAKQKASKGQGDAVVHISATALSAITIPLPPPAEQRAIAAALSDVDGLLGGLDRLIAKKRDLKQAAMQQLLTGQTRLPGFHGEWEVKTFGDVITHCFSGATPRRNRPEFFRGNIRWITSGELNYNVITDTIEKISTEAVAATNLAIIPAGTFLMAITGLEAEGTRGACGIVGKPSATNQSCMAVFPTEVLVTDYLFYYYVFRGKQLALQYCQGTKQQSYTARLVKTLPIDLPPTPAEQTAIAMVLTEMDAELAALEQRREKTRALKQAMMQELLTGRTRLV